MRKPGVEPQDRVVELPRHAVFAARGWVLGQLFDLTGDGIEPLVDFGDVARLMRRKLALGGCIHPVARRAGALRGACAAFPDGRVETLSAP